MSTPQLRNIQPRRLILAGRRVVAQYRLAPAFRSGATTRSVPVRNPLGHLGDVWAYPLACCVIDGPPACDGAGRWR